MGTDDYVCSQEQKLSYAMEAMAAAMISVMDVAQDQEAELRERGSSQVWIKTPEGGTATMRITDEDTTESLRQAVARRLNIPTSLPRLM